MQAHLKSTVHRPCEDSPFSVLVHCFGQKEAQSAPPYPALHVHVRVPVLQVPWPEHEPGQLFTDARHATPMNLVWQRHTPSWSEEGRMGG